jgi:uncharacterized protein (DUF433 family)
MEPTLANPISIRPEVCGGKPCVGGTRIRVWDLHVMHHLEGRCPTELLTAYPQLSLADVHAALAYYLDHRQEIEAQMEQADTIVARLEAEHNSRYLPQPKILHPYPNDRLRARRAAGAV